MASKERVYVMAYDGVRGEEARDELEDFITHHLEPGVYNVLQSGKVGLNIRRVGTALDASTKVVGGLARNEHSVTVI